MSGYIECHPGSYRLCCSAQVLAGAGLMTDHTRPRLLEFPVLETDQVRRRLTPPVSVIELIPLQQAHTGASLTVKEEREA